MLRLHKLSAGSALNFHAVREHALLRTRGIQYSVQQSTQRYLTTTPGEKTPESESNASSEQLHPLYADDDLGLPKHLRQAARRKRDWMALLARREADPSLERNARLGLERIELPDVAHMTPEEKWANYDGAVSGTPLSVVAGHAKLGEHMFGDKRLVRLRRHLRVSYGGSGDSAASPTTVDPKEADSTAEKADAPADTPKEEDADDSKAQKKAKKKKDKGQKDAKKVEEVDTKPKPSTPKPIVFNTNNNVYYGNHLKPAHLQVAPEVHFEGREDTLYTLVLSSPDANVYDDEKEALHWMVANIADSDVSTGVEVCKYLPPTPPYGFGPCRYVFALYEQNTPEPIDSLTADMIPGLSSFITKKFISQHSVKLKEVAFFQSEYDASVSKTFKEAVGLDTEPAYEALV